MLIVKTITGSAGITRPTNLRLPDGSAWLSHGPSPQGTEKMAMNRTKCILLGVAAAAPLQAWSGATMARAESLPYDVPSTVNGIEVVCTGIGSSIRYDSRWAAYPLKIEAVGAEGQYLGNVTIVVERAGERVVELSCSGPWILARLQPGAYTFTATYENLSTTSEGYVPATGQGRIIMRFPEAGGAVSREHTTSSQ